MLNICKTRVLKWRCYKHCNVCLCGTEPVRRGVGSPAGTFKLQIETLIRGHTIRHGRNPCYLHRGCSIACTAVQIGGLLRGRLGFLQVGMRRVASTPHRYKGATLKKEAVCSPETFVSNNYNYNMASIAQSV